MGKTSFLDLPDSIILICLPKIIDRYTRSLFKAHARKAFSCNGDLSSLINFKSVKSIKFFAERGVLFTSLSAFESLTNLDISSCHGATLFNVPLPTTIMRLTLASCSRITDLSPLISLSNLIFLDISRCTGIRDLSSLRCIKSLTGLDISGCCHVKDIIPLEGLTSLTELIMSNTKISDLEPIRGLTNLRFLDISYCRYIIDVSPITSILSINIECCPSITNMPLWCVDDGVS